MSHDLLEQPGSQPLPALSVKKQSGVAPYWRTKRLEEMTNAEWESLCDGCGRCCLEKVEADDTHEVYPLDVGCQLLDPASAGCSDYTNRKRRVPGCVKLTAANVAKTHWLPPTCAYRRLALGQPLEWWHPLESGDPASVRAAGISVVGRFIQPHQAGPREWHTVDWPSRGVDRERSQQWRRAMFGGINAAIPTPFDANANVDLDLMAAHCFWLLSNGCHGLNILDNAGEVAALSMHERLLIMRGLTARGIPASKLLLGIGPGALSDWQRLLHDAKDCGIRGVLLNTETIGFALPAGLLHGPIRDLTTSIDPSIHLYLSFPATGAAVAARLTALEAFMSRFPGRLRGIRDEAPGCALGLATLDRFSSTGLEVYAAAPADLMGLVRHGGAGLIGPAANVLSHACARIIEITDPGQAAMLQQTIVAIGNVLNQGPTVPAIKTLLARRTGRAEWNRMRLPLRPAGPVKRSALFAAFYASGLTPRAALPEEQHDVPSSSH